MVKRGEIRKRAAVTHAVCAFCRRTLLLLLLLLLVPLAALLLLRLRREKCASTRCFSHQISHVASLAHVVLLQASCLPCLSCRVTLT